MSTYPPLITVWLQVRVLPGPPIASGSTVPSRSRKRSHRDCPMPAEGPEREVREFGAFKMRLAEVSSTGTVDARGSG
jgi:hypothetical protein